MKKLPIAIVVALLFTAGVVFQDTAVVRNIVDVRLPAFSESAGDQAIARAFETRARGLQVEGSGKVVRVLPDDNDGSRHQRFILRLNSGHTLLVAHNIDLAPRVPSLHVDDTVAFYGEYEWNPQGGVIHWTHHDPQGRHVAGWLKHEGKVYREK